MKRKEKKEFQKILDELKIKSTLAPAEESLKTRLYTTIPNDFYMKQGRRISRGFVRFAYGLVTLLMVSIIIWQVFKMMETAKDEFIPSKKIFLIGSSSGEDPFKPTKTIRLTDRDLFYQKYREVNNER